MAGTTRISLDVNPEMKALIEDITARTGGSQAEALRKAVVLMKVVKDAESRGQNAAIVDSDNKVISKLVGI